MGIPDNKYNPYLEDSNLPDGTVFIAVGAIIAGVALAVLLWILVMAMLKRRRAKNNFEYAMAVSSSAAAAAAAAAAANTKRGSKNKYRDDAEDDDGFSAVGDNEDIEATAGTPAGSRFRNPLRSHARDSQKIQSMMQAGLFVSPTAEALNSARGGGRDSIGGGGGLDSLTSSLGGGVGIAGAFGPARTSVYAPTSRSFQHTRTRSSSGSGSGGGGATSSLYLVPPSQNQGGGHSRRSSSAFSLMPASAAGPGSTRMSFLSVGRSEMGDRPATVRAPSAYLDDFLSGGVPKEEAKEEEDKQQATSRQE